MSHWLPHFYVTGTCLCDFDGEAEGVLVGVEWLGLIVELTIARRGRVID